MLQFPVSFVMFRNILWCLTKFLSIAIIVDSMYLFYFIVYFLLMTFLDYNWNFYLYITIHIFIYISLFYCYFIYHFLLLPHIFKVIVNLLLLYHIFLCSYTTSSIFDLWIYLLSLMLVLYCFVVISIFM